MRPEVKFRAQAPENGLLKALFGLPNDKLQSILAVSPGFFSLLPSKNLTTRLKLEGVADFQSSHGYGHYGALFLVIRPKYFDRNWVTIQNLLSNAISGLKRSAQNFRSVFQ